VKVLDLFSGIGGFSIGLEKAGFETVAFCEIEEYPKAVLRKHWPDTPIYNDVRELTGERLRADGIFPDVIVGGYPCQPFSVAGVRRGEDDDRHLWPEVYRLVKEIRPAWGIFENVAGHISMGLDEVLSDLEAEGYAARPFVIPACGVDAPHKRDRVWIVAKNVGDTQRGRQRGNDGRRSGQEPENRCKDVADTKSKQGSPNHNGQKQGAAGKSEQGQLRRSGGGSHPTLWPTEPDVGRVANGVSNRSHRIKALGNAVVPQIPEQIGRIILEVEGLI
jgi:DNA (cytosine-5)-methyltransferase 1